jgi:Flp pilus assembly secretin CpaC
MTKALRLGSGLAFLLLLALNPISRAGDEQLQLARNLYEMQEYAKAQEALTEVNRDKLAADEVKVYDDLLKELPAAIQGATKAKQDMADGQKAYDDGRWRDAEAIYKRVQENKYAKGDMKVTAREQLQRITEKLQLAEAAKPAGPVRKEAEKPQQPPAEPKPAADAKPAAEVKPAEAKPAEAKPAAAPAPAPADKPQDKSQAAEKPADAQAPAIAAPPQRRTLVDELRSRDELLWQRAVAKMQEVVQKAGEAIAAENFEEARQLADSAIQVIEANRAYAQPPAKYETALKTAQDLQAMVTAEYDRWSRTEAEKQRLAISEQIERRRQLQEQQRTEKIDQLFKTARQLSKEQRYREAAEAMRQVLILDPANENAGFWLETYEDYWSLNEQKNIDREISSQTRQILQQADEVRIPWSHDILYPKNWLEISAKRAGIEGSVSGDFSFELNRTLESVQPEVRFDEQPFDEVVNLLNETNDLNIAVDWDDLASNGVQRDKPISLKLKDVKLRAVLGEVLNQVGGDVPLKFSVGEGLVRIATKGKLDRDKYILVYDIRDLIVDIPRFIEAPQFEAGAALGGLNNTLSTPEMFRQWREADPESTRKLLDPSARIVEDIKEIIRDQVEPDSWRESGGDASLHELNGQMIVYNTSEAHSQTRALLSQLREARALMIGVEARFLIVSSNFLEELGVDLDFVFNQGSAGYDPAFTNGASGIAPVTDPFTGAQVLIPRPYSYSGVTPAVPGFGGGAMPQVTPLQPYGNAGYVPTGTGIVPQFNEMSPITAQQSSLNLTDPTALNTGIPGSFGRQGLQPSMNIAGSFLDNLQVDFLIRATQANRRSSIVQAPRLMMFNGQRAWVAVTRNRQYVSTVTPSVAEGAVGVQPVQQGSPSGTSLDVEGTISADRKYVTITVRTGIATEASFEKFEVQRASGNSPGIFILLPDQEFRSIRTTVSVPDGGTVLLGGLKQTGEIEVEAGVPILSKIPILKRAFTNTSKVKDTQTLLMLLKAKILIQKEAEEEAFPTLSSSMPG